MFLTSKNISISMILNIGKSELASPEKMKSSNDFLNQSFPDLKSLEDTLQNLNLTLDSSLYRENSLKSEISENAKIEHSILSNEKTQTDSNLQETLTNAKFLTYKNRNYYNVKNFLRQKKYDRLNTQCPILSLPGVLDLFVDSESSRLITKLHLKDENQDHLFKLFRSRGTLGIDNWRHLIVQVSPNKIEIYINSILDTMIDLKKMKIWFGKNYDEDTNKKEGQNDFTFSRFSGDAVGHYNGILIGNIDNYSLEIDNDEYLNEKNLFADDFNMFYSQSNKVFFMRLK